MEVVQGSVESEGRSMRQKTWKAIIEISGIKAKDEKGALRAFWDRVDDADDMVHVRVEVDDD